MVRAKRTTAQSRRRALITIAILSFLGSVYLDTSLGHLSSPVPTYQTNDRPDLVLQRGHSLGVNCAAFAPDGSWLASGGADNSVLIWQVASGRQLRALTGHSGYVRSVAISPDGRSLASGSNDRTVRVWDSLPGRELYVLAGHSGPVTAVAFSPDGRWLASGSSDKTIKLWDLTNGKESRTLSKHSAPVTVLSFRLDGASLASAGNTEIILWDTKSWQDQRIFRRHKAEVTAIAFRHDTDWIASAAADGSVLIWSNGSDRERFAIRHNSSGVSALKFSGDGSLVAINSDGEINSWDSDTGKEKRSVAVRANRELLAFACFSSDASMFASGTGKRMLSIQDVTSGEIIVNLQSHSTGVNSVAFSADGRWFAAATNDSSVRLWQVATGRELPRLLGHAGYVTTLSFSPDSRLLASGSRSGEVRIWDVTTTRLAFSLPSQAKGINAVAFSPNGKSLAVAGMDHNLEVWDLDQKAVRLLTGHSHEITTVAFAEKGRFVISAGRDKTIRVWDFITGQSMKTLDNPAEINGLAINPDGNLLATANADKTVRLWDVASGALTKTFAGHTGEVLAVSFSPDGRLIASAGSDHSVILWDPQTGTSLRQLQGSREGVTSVAFSGNSSWVLAGSEDGSLMIWGSEPGTLRATLVSVANADHWLVTTPDGLFDGTPESWNLMLWRFGGETFSVMPVEAYFNEFYYPGVLADILADKDPKASEDIVQKDRRQPQIKLKVKGGNISNFTARDAVIELEITAALPDKSQTRPSGARDLRLFRNGLLVKAWTGDVLKSALTRTIQAKIPIVAGDNRISAYAFNSDNIKSLDANLVVSGADTLKRLGTAYLLMIGVAQYENPQYNLRYPVADASEMETQLRGNQEKLGRYSPVKTITLVNDQATKSNILLVLERLAGRIPDPLPSHLPQALSTIKPAEPEDAIVIYFSGHGTAVSDRFYLIPHDIGYKGPRDNLDAVGLETIVTHSISDEELEEALRPLDADQLLLVIDACNSGQAVESQEKRRGPMNSRGLAQLAYEKGMYVLTASQNIEVAYEAEALKHSYLAYALLEEGIRSGAADHNRDGKIFLKEWFDYASERVPKIRRMRFQQRKELVEEEADEQNVQRPRVFYTREGGARSFLVAQHLN